MFFDMLRAHIPKSLRAGIALVVMLAALYTALVALQGLLGNTPNKSWWQLVAGLAVGVPAMVCFYYFQSKDGSMKSLDSVAMETIAEAGKKPTQITPANLPDESQTPKPKA